MIVRYKEEGFGWSFIPEKICLWGRRIALGGLWLLKKRVKPESDRDFSSSKFEGRLAWEASFQRNFKIAKNYFRH